MTENQNLFDDEIVAFVQAPMLMRLATIGADGYPQVTPVWYLADIERKLFLTSTEKNRTKSRNVSRNHRVGASIDSDALPYRGVTLKGVARLREDDIDDIVRRICARYVPSNELDDMLNWLYMGQRVVIEIEPHSIVKVGAGWHAR